jgi:hypothetical protein
MSGNPTLKSLVNKQASRVGDLLHAAKINPEEAELYMSAATDQIILTFSYLADNPQLLAVKKFGVNSFRPKSNYESLAPTKP